MSRGGDGSDFSDENGGRGGEYLQRGDDPEDLHQSKRLKLGGGDSPTRILSLHTDWVQREPEDRATTAYVGGDPGDGPIPVPQSDFEIEINSTGQEGNGGSPTQESGITLTSASITIEPRILTIDSRLPSSVPVTTTTASSSSGAAIPVHKMIAHLRDEEEEEEEDEDEPSMSSTMVTNLSTAEPVVQAPLVEDIPVSMVASQTPDFSALMAGAKGMLQVPTDQQSLIHQHPDLSGGGQYMQAPGDGTGTGGPLYVMIPPTTNSAELLQVMQQGQVQRPLMPRLSTGALASPISDDGRKHKELIRKQTHNEVERRRRDRINELIKILAEVVPGCQKKDSSNGNIVGYVYSKGTVLEKTVEYVRELIMQNEQLVATAKLAEKSASALHILQNQITVLEKENTFLRAQMVQLGIDTSSTALSGARSLLSNPLAQSLLNTQVTPPPPPPTTNTSQLLVSLAQTLTSNPLLASLSQLNNNPSSTSAVSPVVANESPVTASGQSSQLVPPNSQAAILMNSLVQTLATIANSNTPAPPPPPQSSGLSASAAMSLLNSLMMAQNALSATTTHTTQAIPLSSHPSASPTPASLLVSPHAQDNNKITPPM
ncbi:PREDICTED: uncharacterized protein LOC105312975 [Amphimedon queenslandica]|uniref:BHLH domain-containing protein n=1 Tax=Amphimedon queenslandica TaxID=400682 RepID=A0A1X7UR13_AMPQE|nr:PREDICTED: uncharacterized protein LOC105312975 [Amphimedon queenslandica]|eukprot:XP_011404335.1 PREDICTED: uncharacterized protein LOC105312975 [Amphimedon queenslandica]